MPADTGGAIARLLLNAGAVHVSAGQPFILAAGWASPVYVDVRLLLGEKDARDAVTDLAAAYLAAALPANSLDAVAGAETAGIPFAALLAGRSGLKLRYVRKRPLGVGRNAQVEGGAVDGLRVLVVDDLTADGASKLGFARGLRAAGALVEHVLTVFFYRDVFPGVGDRLAEAGLKLHALATWADILRVDEQEARLPLGERGEIERFLADPVAWSARHGGRTSLARRN